MSGEIETFWYEEMRGFVIDSLSFNPKTKVIELDCYVHGLYPPTKVMIEIDMEFLNLIEQRLKLQFDILPEFNSNGLNHLFLEYESKFYFYPNMIAELLYQISKIKNFYSAENN